MLSMTLHIFVLYVLARIQMAQLEEEVVLELELGLGREEELHQLMSRQGRTQTILQGGIIWQVCVDQKAAMLSIRVSKEESGA